MKERIEDYSRRDFRKTRRSIMTEELNTTRSITKIYYDIIRRSM